MYMILLVIFLLVSISLISIVMLQKWKSLDMGGSFCNPSASIKFFCSPGSGNFMTRMTSIFATFFFIISLILGNLTSNKNMSENKLDNIAASIEFDKEIGADRLPVASTGEEIPH